MSEEAPSEAPGRRLEIILLLFVLVVVAAAILTHLATGGDDDADRAGGDGGAPTAGASADGSAPLPPDAAPGRGSYVQSTVEADGTVSVRQWIRSGTPVRALKVAAVPPQRGQSTSAQAVDVVVRALDGTVLATKASVGGDSVRLPLRDAVPNLYLSYRITGGIDDATQTVQGRMLAEVLAMDVDYSGSSGTVKREVSGPGTVTNVACVRVSAEADAPPKPCGKPTGGGGWTVDLRGIDRSDRLLAQIDAPS